MSCVRFYNGKIYDGKSKFLNEFYVKNGKISLKEQKAEKEIDLNQKLVLPGFIDSHTHMVTAGLNKLGLDLSSCKDLNELFQRVKRYLKNSNNTAVFGYGFDETKLKEKRAPTKEELDNITDRTPFFIQRIDHHSLFCNSEFEKKYNIKSTNGFVNAEKYEDIQIKLWGNFSNKEYEEGLKKMEREAFQNGVTSVHTLEGMEGFTGTIDYLLKNKNKFDLGFIIYPQINDLEYVLNKGFDKIGGCILLDGSFGSRTAALKTPYEDDNNNYGRLYYDSKKLYKFVEKAHKNNLQLSFHAIGNRAIEQIVDIYSKVLSKHPRKGHRHRIEHFELADDSLIKKAADLDLYISYQPVFEYYWGGENEMYDKRLGKRRFLTNRYKTADNYNLNFAFGSDCDITPIKPLLGIHAAVNRKNEKENISVEKAIQSYTYKSAEIGFRENKIGTIAENKIADFIILEKDIFRIKKSKIKNVNVEKVYKKGQLVYKK